MAATGRVIFSAFLVFCGLSVLPAWAQFPDKPIRLVVPFSPGGSTDLMARLVGKLITGPLGQSVIVENRPGAGSAVGSTFVARSAADGYTLLLGSTSSLSVNPLLRKLAYEPSDFAPITLVATIPHVLIINPSIPATNLSEFISYAKVRATKLNYGSAGGPGSPHHLAGVMLNQLAGLSAVDIPFNGGGEALKALISGQVDVMSMDLAPSLPLISSGRVRALAIATSARSTQIPSIPTTVEAGLPDFQVTGWYGIVAPAATPKIIIERLAAAISNAVNDPEMRASLANLAAKPEGGTSQSFSELIERERIKWAKIIKDGNIRLPE